MQLGRFQFVPFWKVTNNGWLPEYFKFKGNPSCDEWHNIARFWIVPFIGDLTIFKKPYITVGPEHLYGRGPDGYDGTFYYDCDLCEETMRFFNEDV